MTDTILRRRSSRLRMLASIWWVRVLVIFLASRLVSTILLLAFASVQPANQWTGAHPDYASYSTMWDGLWYNIVAVSGYPSALPYDSAGHIGQNAWAFLPGYPWLVAIVMFLTRLPWPIAAVLVSVLFAAAASLMLYRLFRLRLGTRTSTFAVAVFCFAPLSPLLQVAYAESMYLFFLVLGLYLLLKRRYWALAPVVVVMSFTRPSGLAFALALGLHIVYRWLTRRRDPFPLRQGSAAVTVTILSVVSGAAWPVIAGLATGVPNAYTDTELSWRVGYIGYTELVPFDSWPAGAKWWFTTWLGLPEWFGYTVLGLVVALFAVTLFLPSVRRLGIDLRFWLVAYALYLLAVFFPQSSTFRLLMPFFPLAGALASVRNPVFRTVLIVAGVAGQIGWLYICWDVQGADWSPP